MRERLSSIQTGKNLLPAPDNIDTSKPLELSEDRKLVLIFSIIFERGRVVDGSAMDQCLLCPYNNNCSGLIPLGADLDVGCNFYVITPQNP